jgi:hypothetical protein
VKIEVSFGHAGCSQQIADGCGQKSFAVENLGGLIKDFSPGHFSFVRHRLSPSKKTDRSDF